MAESFIRKYGSDRFDVYSAGTDPAAQINPLTYRALAETGEDLEGHAVNGLKEYFGRLPVHTLIIACDGANKSCPSVWSGIRERLLWPFEDPAAAEGSDVENLGKFRAVRDQIDEKVQKWRK